MYVLFLKSGGGTCDEFGGVLGGCGLAVEVIDSCDAGAWLFAGKPYALILVDAVQPAAVWGSSVGERDNMVTVGILRLRRKLDDPFDLKLLHTVRG